MYAFLAGPVTPYREQDVASEDMNVTTVTVIQMMMTLAHCVGASVRVRCNLLMLGRARGFADAAAARGRGGLD